MPDRSSEPHRKCESDSPGTGAAARPASDGQPRYGPLLSPVGRRFSAVVVVVTVVVLVILVSAYARTSGPGAIDAALDPLAASTLRNHWFDTHDGLFLRIGDTDRFAALIVVLVSLTGCLRRSAGVVLLLLGCTIPLAVTELVLAPLVGRQLDGTFSLPSGHATAATSATACVIILVLGRSSPRSPLRWVVSGLVVLVVVLVAVVNGVAIVAEGTHYATDVLAGWCVALAVVLSTALTIDRMAVSHAGRSDRRANR